MPENDRLKRSLSGFVRGVFGAFDYHALYPCQVVVQNADSSVDLQPDASTRMPGLQHVKLRYGLPGATVKVQAGTRVLLGFDAGDPSAPYASIWDPSGVVVELDLQANTIVLNGGSAGVARNGDEITITPVQFAAAGAANGGGPVTITSNLKGSITTGSSTVKSG